MLSSKNKISDLLCFLQIYSLNFVILKYDWISTLYGFGFWQIERKYVIDIFAWNRTWVYLLEMGLDSGWCYVSRDWRCSLFYFYCLKIIQKLIFFGKLKKWDENNFWAAHIVIHFGHSLTLQMSQYKWSIFKLCLYINLNKIVDSKAYNLFQRKGETLKSRICLP